MIVPDCDGETAGAVTLAARIGAMGFLLLPLQRPSSTARMSKIKRKNVNS
jgi:hypothetical protein